MNVFLTVSVKNILFLFSLTRSIFVVAKKLRTNNNAMKFVKAASVFADWVEDTPKILQAALAHDLRNWKLHKITDDISE